MCGKGVTVVAINRSPGEDDVIMISAWWQHAAQHAPAHVFSAHHHRDQEWHVAPDTAVHADSDTDTPAPASASWPANVR